MPPVTMEHLPVDERGYIVPFFVLWRDGRPQFEAIDPDKYAACVRDDLCWLCGHKLLRRRAFVLGPMCVVNRVSAEPPSHVTCAEYALQVCPFLTMPLAKRVPVPEDAIMPAGEMITRNPGAAVLWICYRGDYKFVRYPESGGVLVHIEEEPAELRAWARGQDGAWDAVAESMASGLPLLEAACQNDADFAALYQLVGVATALTRRAEKGLL